MNMNRNILTQIEFCAYYPDQQLSQAGSYFDSLRGQSLSPENIDTLSSRFLGTRDPIHDAVLKGTLLTAIGKALVPATQIKIPILLGPQGIGKTRFVEALFGPQQELELQDIKDLLGANALIVGTSNCSNFELNVEDASRFHLIPCQNTAINVERLEQVRDRLWAAALQTFETLQANTIKSFAN